MQVGDGTTTVTLLASEFLKQVKPFIEEGVHAQVAVKSFRKAANLVSECCSGKLNFGRYVVPYEEEGLLMLVPFLEFGFQKLANIILLAFMFKYLHSCLSMLTFSVQ